MNRKRLILTVPFKVEESKWPCRRLSSALQPLIASFSLGDGHISLNLTAFVPIGFGPSIGAANQ